MQRYHEHIEKEGVWYLFALTPSNLSVNNLDLRWGPTSMGPHLDQKCLQRSLMVFKICRL